RSDVSVLGLSILWIPLLRVPVPCLRSATAGGRLSAAAGRRVPASRGVSTDTGRARGRVPAWQVRALRRWRDSTLAVGVGARRSPLHAVNSPHGGKGYEEQAHRQPVSHGAAR